MHKHTVYKQESKVTAQYELIFSGQTHTNLIYKILTQGLGQTSSPSKHHSGYTLHYDNNSITAKTLYFFKVIAATNRVDILDPALLRSGRLDRKIEFPMPNEEARARIMQIHSRKMNVSPDVNYEELARCTDDFNGAQCKAVCVEAGMIALRRGATELNHEDYMEGILEVQAKKKANLQYYA